MASLLLAMAAPSMPASGAVAAGEAWRFARRMAVPLAVLWSRFLACDAADPRWPDRDRLVVSAEAEAGLLGALARLVAAPGTDADWEEDSPAGAVMAAPGDPGTALGLAVGVALAERILAARFGRSLVDHRTWACIGPSGVASGLSHEAASLAGGLRLERLTVLWDAGGDDAGDLALVLDTLKRFAACGWAVKAVDAGVPGQVAAALSMALRSKKPTLLACRADGMVPPAVDGVAAEARAGWQAAGARGARARRAWLKRAVKHPHRAEFERAINGRPSDLLVAQLAALRHEFASQMGSGAAPVGERVRESLLAAVPELVGGFAAPELAPLGSRTMGAGVYGGRSVPWSGRVHAASVALNGLALHGGLLPSCLSSLTQADHVRPALWDAVRRRLRAIQVFVEPRPERTGPEEPSFGCGYLAALRAMPELWVMRPADGVELTECWELALRRSDGPTVLILAPEHPAALRADLQENRSARGGYVLAEADGPRQATLIATGRELAVALATRDLLLSEGVRVAVVSLPCWELFAAQDVSYRAAVLGGVFRLGLEAASGFGWERWLGQDGAFIGAETFGIPGGSRGGASPAGLTAEAVASLVRRRLA